MHVVSFSDATKTFLRGENGRFGSRLCENACWPKSPAISTPQIAAESIFVSSARGEGRLKSPVNRAFIQVRPEADDQRSFLVHRFKLNLVGRNTTSSIVSRAWPNPWTGRTAGTACDLARNLLDTLRNRELTQAAKDTAADSGLAHRRVAEGRRLASIYQRLVMLARGRCAMTV